MAGTLSSGSPQYFLSGTLELGEHGWWKLAEMKPPTFTVGMQKFITLKILTTDKNVLTQSFQLLFA